MKHIGAFSRLRLSSQASSPEARTQSLEPIASASNATPVPERSLAQTPGTSSSGRQAHAAFSANSTMQRRLGAAFKIPNALLSAAKENNAQCIHDFASGQLTDIPPDNQRLAWLRILGADKAMHTSMRVGSVATIAAWTEVVKLLPEKSRFAFLSGKIKDSNTESKNASERSFSDLTTRLTRIAPTVGQIAPKEQGLVDPATATPVPTSEIVEQTGREPARSFSQRLMGISYKRLFSDQKDRGDDGGSDRTVRRAETMNRQVSYGIDESESAKNGYRNSIATNIFGNTQTNAMKAWGTLLQIVPNQNKERSRLLFARMDHEAGTPALALLFERGEKQALDQFVELAKQHVLLGDEDIHQVLLDCMPTLKILTATRGAVSGRAAQDWVHANGLEYVNPHGLSGNSKGIAKAFGELVQLVPRKYRNKIFFPKPIWTNFTSKDGRLGQLDPQQARELAHAITLLKAMVPTMTAKERETVLDEIRSRHATKVMGIWKNTSTYQEIKKTWPALDAMLLDLKAELKKRPLAG